MDASPGNTRTPDLGVDVKRIDALVEAAEEWHAAAGVLLRVDLGRQAAAAVANAAVLVGLSLCEAEGMHADEGIDFAVLASVLPPLHRLRRHLLEVDRIRGSWEGHGRPDGEGRLRMPAADPLREDVEALPGILAAAKSLLADGFRPDGPSSPRLADTTEDGRKLDLVRIVADALAARKLPVPAGFAAGILAKESEESLKAMIARVNKVGSAESLAGD